jgi:tRNA threonylcarbamoyladenosine biosynthesis protein TsaB
MRAIGIETSGTVGSVALLEDGRVLAEETFEKGLRHGRALVPAIGRALAAAGLAKADVDVFAVGTGPGSYTGLRVGIATAQMLAFALGKRIAGVPSFDAIAAAVPGELARGKASVVVAIEARKDHVYCARYAPRGGALAREGDFDVRDPARVLEGAARPVLLVGDAAAKYPALARPDATLAPPELGHAHARAVARLALERLARGEGDRLEAVRPLYLRASIPEEKRAASDNDSP